MSDLFRIDDRVALVTGAGRGLGRAMAVGLASAGADLVLVARREADLAETRAAVEATGRRAVVVPGDVIDPDVAPKAVAAALETFGRIDILVNNAGLYSMAPAAEADIDEWRQVLEVNLVGSMRFIKAVAGPLLEQGSGKVVNIASVLGTFGVGEATAYGAAKAGVMGMTRALAVEWGGRGIQVNAIAPGLFNTDMSAGVFENQDFYDGVVGGIPRGRHGEPDEIVGTAVWLCSDASNHVLGQVIHVDGGATIA